MGGRDLERRRTDRIDPYKKLEKRIRLVLSLSQEDFMSLLPSKYRCGMKEGRKENTITNLSEMADFGEGCTDTILLSK